MHFSHLPHCNHAATNYDGIYQERHQIDYILDLGRLWLSLATEASGIALCLSQEHEYSSRKAYRKRDEREERSLLFQYSPAKEADHKGGTIRHHRHSRQFKLSDRVESYENTGVLAGDSDQKRLPAT